MPRIVRKRLVLIILICLFLVCCGCIYLALQFDDAAESGLNFDIGNDRVELFVKQRPEEKLQKLRLWPVHDVHGPKANATHAQKQKGSNLLKLRHSKNKSTTLLKGPNAIKSKVLEITGNSSWNAPTIPHVIHQIWDTRDIPSYLEYWVRSWKQNHPNWEYWLWTLEDGHELIKRAFPSFLPLYEAYPEDIFRIDALRLFILYAFGGVYVDIDMLSLAPLDIWTYDHYCILTQETYEHSFVIREMNTTNIVNGFFACRAQHPFFKLAIESLAESAKYYFGDFLHATGPYYVDSIYRTFNSSRHSKKNGLTVVPPKYFLPTFDATEEGVISQKCAPSRYKQLSPTGQKVCADLWRRDYKNKAPPESYTDHKWLHLYMYDPNWKKKNTKKLLDIVPTARNVTEVVSAIEGVLL